jgi:hypothetical protein
MSTAKVVYTIIYKKPYMNLLVTWVLNKAMGHRRNCFYYSLTIFTRTYMIIIHREV